MRMRTPLKMNLKSKVLEMEMQIASVENADKRLTEIPNLNFAISAKADYYNGLIQGFKDGAKWADKTMVEKACEWLKENIDIYAKVVINPESHYPEITTCDTFEKNFKKAMEE